MGLEYKSMTPYQGALCSFRSVQLTPLSRSWTLEWLIELKWLLSKGPQPHPMCCLWNLRDSMTLHVQR